MFFLDGIRRLFSHGDQCEIHATFQPECEACQLARLRHQASLDMSPDPFTDSVDMSSVYDASVDTGSVDTSSIDTGSSDFGGFDGGDSGGGGSSGDF